MRVLLRNLIASKVRKLLRKFREYSSGLFLIIFNSTIPSNRRYLPPKILLPHFYYVEQNGFDRWNVYKNGLNFGLISKVYSTTMGTTGRNSRNNSLLLGMEGSRIIGRDNYLSWRGDRAVWITDGLGSRGTATSEWVTLRGGSGDVAAGTTDLSW